MPDLRRLVDVVVSVATLAVGAPILIAALAATKWESSGPVLFTQIRIGRNKKPFRLFKVRTMNRTSSDVLVTVGNDDRITRVGRLLRATKLDELPQLWNVIRGDMSLIGPRPEVERYTSTYPEDWDLIFAVRPGLTDLASLTFRDEAALLAHARDPERAYREVVMPMKVELALGGIRSQSIGASLTVVARTAMSLLQLPDTQRDAVLKRALARIWALNREHEVT